MCYFLKSVKKSINSDWNCFFSSELILLISLDACAFCILCHIVLNSAVINFFITLHFVKLAGNGSGLAFSLIITAIHELIVDEMSLRLVFLFWKKDVSISEID